MVAVLPGKLDTVKGTSQQLIERRAGGLAARQLNVRVLEPVEETPQLAMIIIWPLPADNRFVTA